MPYASGKQRRYMHARHPEVARRWDAEAKHDGKDHEKKHKRKTPTPANPYR